MTIRWMVVAAWALGWAATGMAQTDPAKLTLDRIFVSADFRSGGDHGGQWLEAGTLARAAPGIGPEYGVFHRAARGAGAGTRRYFISPAR